MSRKTRKLIWSAPLVAVLAVAGALALFVTLAPNGVFADEQTGQVNLEQPTAEGPRSINLAWAAPDGGPAPMGYRIDVSKDGHVWSELVASQTETEYVHTLTESEVNTGSDGATTNRYYRVYALNSHGPGQESEIKIGTTMGVNVPEPVEMLTVSAGGPNEVDVTWEAPTDNGGISITGYTVLCKIDNIYVVADDLTGANAKKVGADGRSHTREKLDADTTYFCRVFAANKVGASGSGAVKSVTTDKADRPGAPTNVVALQSAPDDPASTINLYWLQPTSDGGRDITHYIVEYKYKNEPWRAVTADPLSVASDADSYPTGNTGATAQIDYVHTIPADRDDDDTTEPARAKDDTIRYQVYARHQDGTSRASRGFPDADRHRPQREPAGDGPQARCTYGGHRRRRYCSGN